MRFLCLHGRGTNAEIFKEQTARIREAIGQDNEFVFINGKTPADAVPGIGSVTASQVCERLGFVPLDAEPSVYQAFFLDLRHFIQSQGPFDGLIGFSEGASIAATMMVEDARRPFAKFKCAIFFCALKTVDPDSLQSDTGLPRFLDYTMDGVLVQIPTAHIWSSCDDVALNTSQEVAAIFDESSKETLVHSLGHDIPGSRSDEALPEAIRVIERTIEKGKCLG
ncbi:hypothetical protein M434DRAFT_38030 [Hypoxylon sp. CO27-5]|nr:hypothetical protein M434DRAFT_38030 [Hypoxylon sp. CO27-5]